MKPADEPCVSCRRSQEGTSAFVADEFLGRIVVHLSKALKTRRAFVAENRGPAVAMPSGSSCAAGALSYFLML
jgi:hypothetical protein